MEVLENMKLQMLQAYTENPEDEQIILQSLIQQVEVLLANQPDMLMSMLYRLDVEESKINAALHPAAPDPAHIGLAKLIWERQKQRLFTKKNFQTPPIQDGDEWNL